MYQANYKNFWFCLVLYLISSNLILNISSIYTGLARPWINLDYILLFLFFILAKSRRLITGILMLLLFIAGFFDILVMAIQVFPFIQLGDLLYLSSFIFFGPQTYQLLTLAGLFYLLLFVLFTNKLANIIPKKNYTIIWLGIILCLVLCFINHDTVRSQSYFFLQNHQASFNLINHQDRLLVDNKFDSVTKDLFMPTASPNKKILLIINESWGQTNDPELMKAVLQPLYDKQQSLEFITTGGFYFIGATVGGELRALCQKNPLVLDISQVKDSEFKGCLPEQLKNKGYQTLAIHGSTSSMYDRTRWYKLVGFDEVNFSESFPTLRNCIAFMGKCDYDLMPLIAEKFASPQNKFVYWMTLNTHTPYNDTLFIDGFDCPMHNLAEDSESCHNLKLQYQFFARLAQFIDTPQMKGVEVRIVGDHSPPIADIRKNFNVFKGTNVAWVKFKIKS